MHFCTEENVDLLVELLSKEDEAVVIATDTVLGILSKSEDTIKRIKLREFENKKTVKLISSLSQIEKKLSHEFVKIANKFWPGPLTLIYEGQGYRMPNNKLLLDAISKSGEIYASSANITGNPTATNINQAKEEFKNSKIKIHYIETSKNLENNIPSTIFNLDNLSLVREGAVSLKEIINLVQKN